MQFSLKLSGGRCERQKSHQDFKKNQKVLCPTKDKILLKQQEYTT